MTAVVLGSAAVFFAVWVLVLLWICREQRGLLRARRIAIQNLEELNSLHNRLDAYRIRMLETENISRKEVKP